MVHTDRTAAARRLLSHVRSPLSREAFSNSAGILGSRLTFRIAIMFVIVLILVALGAGNSRQHRSLYGQLLTGGIPATATVLETKMERRSIKPGKGSLHHRRVMMVRYEFRDTSDALHTRTIARLRDRAPLPQRGDHVEILYDPRNPRVNAPRASLERQFNRNHGVIWLFALLAALYPIAWLARYVQWRWPKVRGRQ